MPRTPLRSLAAWTRSLVEARTPEADFREAHARAAALFEDWVAEEAFPPGTVRKWRTGSVIKTRDGKWVPYRGSALRPAAPAPAPAPAAPASPPAVKSSDAIRDSFASSAAFVGSDKDTEQLFKENGRWTPERKKLHAAYTASLTDVPVQDEPVVFMTGGGPASGKTFGLLRNPNTHIPNASQAVHTDPDGAKEWIPEYRTNNKSDDKSVAARVHEESSDMAKGAIAEGLRQRKHVVYDSTGDSGIEKLSAKVQQLRDLGAKKVIAHYATVDVEEAIKRSDKRAQQTGRFVPHAIIRKTHADVSSTLVAAIERGIYDSVDLWDTQQDSPTHVVSYDKEKGLKIHDATAWEAFKARANS
jgi:hypothetical protein